MATARRLAYMRVLPEEYKHKCPCCGVDVPETVTHLLVECRRWNGIRREVLGEVLAQIQAVVAASDAVADNAETVATLLSGGEVGGVSLENWAEVKKGHVSSDAEASDSEEMSAQQDAPVAAGAGSRVEICALVAKFLQSIWHLRTRMLSRVAVGNHASPRADAPVE